MSANPFSEFHHQKNHPFKPEDFSSGSNKKIWWICDKGHEWEAPVYRRINGSGCPYCSGNKPSSENNLSLHPVSKEFHYERNSPLRPEDFLPKSHKKIWWICDKGHEWEAIPAHRTNGRGCPLCSGQKPSPENNLSLHSVAKEFHYKKNHPFKPENYTLSSNKKIWWICNKGHEWEAQINKRTDKLQKCPFCAGRKSSKNNNLSLHPVAKEFHYERNDPLKPEDFTLKSGKKIWWICDKGHEWETKISHRTNGVNCPTCSHSGTSRPEQEILEFITYLGLYSIHRYKLDGVEADIFIPEKNLAIEHNGLYWHSELHKDKNYHYTKYKHFRDRGIQLIQIWEDEWRDKQDIVKKLLQAKLGLISDRVFARKCKVTKQKCPEFFELNHIQGSVGSSKTYTLEYQGEIVAAMSFKVRKDKEWELVRYATSKSVVGGASKLLKVFEREHSKAKIISFADLCVSNGDIYPKLGFKKDKILKPDYRYFTCIKNTREHKFSYRLKRFKLDPNLIFEENKTESELAKMNNLLRIYDTGKIRFVKLL